MIYSYPALFVKRSLFLEYGGLSSGRRCIEERKDISLRHLPMDLKAQRTDDIIAIYKKGMDALYLEKVTNLIRISESERKRLKLTLDKKLQWSECCHLFGTGLRAFECAGIIDILGMEVGKVFDNLDEQYLEYEKGLLAFKQSGEKL